MTLQILNNKSNYNGVFRADICRLSVKIPNSTLYITAAIDDAKGDNVLTLLFGTHPQPQMLNAHKTLNNYTVINMYHLKELLPATDCRVTAICEGYSVDHDATIYQIYFGEAIVNTNGKLLTPRRERRI